jgi:calmodulin
LLRGSGAVALRDIGTVLRSVGQNPTDAEIAELTRGVTGEAVDFAGFCKLLTAKFVTTAEAEAEIREAFKIFDKNGSGLISAAELRHVMMNLGEPLTAEEAEELIASHVDLDEQGLLNTEEFIQHLLK